MLLRGISILVALLCAAGPAVAKLDKETEDQLYSVLERETRSGDRVTRALAVEAFGVLRPKDTLAYAVDALKDPVWEVRAGAIRALIRLKDKSYAEALFFALTNPKLDIERDLMPILAMLPDGEAVAIAVQVVHDDKATTKNDVIGAFGRLGGPRMGLFFKPLITDKNGALAEGVQNVVISLRTPDALPLFEQVLKVANSEVQLRALDALSSFPKGSKIAFVRGLLKSKDPQIATRAAEVLAHHGDKSATSSLLPMLQSTDEKQIVRALSALAEVAGADLFAATDPLLKKPDQNPDILRGVLEIHYRAKDTKIADTLRILRRADNVRTQALAVYYLGVMEQGRALTSLHEDLFHGDPNVRLAATEAVGGIGSRESIPFLGKALDNSREPQIRTAIVKALASIHDKDIVPIVGFLITDPTPDVRRWAIVALTRVGHKDAVTSLKIAINDSDIEARSEAVKAIVDLDPSEGVTTFRIALGWLPPERLREMAVAMKEGILPYLDMALTCPRDEMRREAVELLKGFPKQEPSLLTAGLERTTDNALKVTLLSRLVAVNAKNELPRVQAFADSTEVILRSAAFRLLGEIGDMAADPILRKALFDSDAQARVVGAIALLRLHQGKK